MFRYSAITFNSHRIHYDVEYTRKEEGYKDLLVHGPLLATVALDEFRKNINCKLMEFEFRMLKPVLVNEEINSNSIIICQQSAVVNEAGTYIGVEVWNVRPGSAVLRLTNTTPLGLNSGIDAGGSATWNFTIL